jgi:hypothetical protein
MNPSDRRRSPRVEVLDKLQGQIVSLDVAVRIREISLGGMSIETQQGFQIGTVQDFMLTLGDGSGVELIGRVVYSRLTTDAARTFYVTGIQFIDDADDTEATVGGLIERVRPTSR